MTSRPLTHHTLSKHVSENSCREAVQNRKPLNTDARSIVVRCVAPSGQTANCGHMCRAQCLSQRDETSKIKSKNSTEEQLRTHVKQIQISKQHGRTISETCVTHNVSPKQHEEIAKIIYRHRRAIDRGHMCRAHRTDGQLRTHVSRATSLPA